MTQLGEGAYQSNDEATEKKAEDQESPRYKIRFSVFFDGTLNNRTNVEQREKNTAVYQQHKPKPGKDNSYEGDKTNVALLEENIDDGQPAPYNLLLSTYIEGPGTEDFESDDTRGYALGTGDTGVKEKTKKGIGKVVGTIEKKLGKNDIIEELVLDVFGFSRGAAGARYFIHKALSDKTSIFSDPEPLADKLRNLGFDIANKNVRVEFVGLYDTVSSEGLRHNDVKSLKLDAVGRREVSTVVHLTAADEHRANFSLTNIRSASNKGREIFLPGAHSDIGGGYRSPVEEELLLNESWSRAVLEQDQAWMINQGWFQASQLHIESPPPLPLHSPHGTPPPPQPYRLTARRTVADNGYAKIPLKIMADFYLETGINLKPIFNEVSQVPDNLTPIHQALSQYAQQGRRSKADDWLTPKPPPWLKSLRHTYLHFSAHYERSAVVLTPHKPRFRKGQRQRHTYHG